MKRYFASAPGRLLLAAFAAALIGGGAFALSGRIVVLAVAMPIAIVIGFIASGWSIAEHGAAALFAVIAAPLALLLFIVGVGVAAHDHDRALGWFFVALGLGAAVRAIGVPALPAPQGQKSPPEQHHASR